MAGKKNRGHWFIYILECENGSLYTGFTADLKRRYEEHLKGTCRAKYTRSFKPVRIACSWIVAGSRASAMRVERLVKAQDRKTKEALLEDPNRLSELVLQARWGRPKSQIILSLSRKDAKD